MWPRQLKTSKVLHGYMIFSYFSRVGLWRSVLEFYLVILYVYIIGLNFVSGFQCRTNLSCRTLLRNEEAGARMRRTRWRSRRCPAGASRCRPSSERRLCVEVSFLRHRSSQGSRCIWPKGGEWADSTSFLSMIVNVLKLFCGASDETRGYENHEYFLGQHVKIFHDVPTHASWYRIS